jgi:molybdate transport system permease protein
MASRQINILTSERVFKVATIAALTILGVFFLSILLSLFPWVGQDTIAWALTSTEIQFAAFLSVTTASLATIFSLIICIPAAHALSRTNFIGKNVVDTFLDLPIVISPIAIGAALLAFFSMPIGAGIQSHIVKFVFHIPGIILAQFAIIAGLAMRLLKSTFDEIDPQYEQVARTLGYNKIRAFSYVTLPLARKGIVATTILIWARAVGEFGATVTLAGATPFKTETLPIAIYLNLAAANIEKTVVVILLLIVIASIALLAVRKFAGRSTIQ